MKDPREIHIKPVWGMEASMLSSDPLWDFEQLRVPYLWGKYGVRGEGVNAFVIDSGVAAHHSMSKVEGLSFLDDDSSPVDGNGHGTWCCGKIGANGVGIAPKCRLVSLRALDSDGSGYTYYTTDALRWISKQKAPHIVNMSLGSSFRSQAQASICKELWDRGCIVVAAAGNENTSDLSYPAAYEGVLAVAAINEASNRAWFSNYGKHIAVSAPGVSCYSTYLNGSYRKLQGTSMASPTVAGLLALGYSYLLKNQSWSPIKIRDTLVKALTETAIDLGNKGKDDLYGYGGIDGERFMQAVAAAT